MFLIQMNRMQCTYDAKQLTDIIDIIWVAEWEGKYVRWGGGKIVDIHQSLVGLTQWLFPPKAS